MRAVTTAASIRYDALLAAARRRIDPVDAEWLLLHVAGRPRSWLYAHGDRTASPQEVAAFDTLLARREAGEPVAYLTGRRGFWTLDLAVTPDTLIPREDTERLVELALERIPPGAASRVADLGTGSGAIALALARERPLARVVGVDRSAAALQVARANARALGLDRVEWQLGNWFAPLAGRSFDLVVSNPPYLADADPHLQAGDLRFEPMTALASGPDGLDDIRRLIAAAPAHLAPGGWLLLEHGHEQGAAVRGLLCERGFEAVATARDLEDRERASSGRVPAR